MVLDNKVSVIVPVYNVEEYLDQCVESIVNQTYTNLEIVLVDDGSPDNCPQICDRWAEQDSRIKVIHKKNGGLSDARNYGIEHATGDYLIFIDSDDYINDNCIEILLNALLENGCSMSAARFVLVYENVFSDEQFSNNIFVVDNKAYWNMYYRNLFKSDNTISGALINGCHKLMKKELFTDIRFPVGRINEDTFTTYKIVSLCERIALVDKPLYNYIYRESSLSHNEDDKAQMKSLDLIEAMKERLDYFISSNIDNDLIKYAYIDLLDSMIERYYVAKCKYNNLHLAQNIKQDYKEVYRLAKQSNAFDNQLYKKRSSLYYLFYINETLFRIIRKLKRVTGNL